MADQEPDDIKRSLKDLKKMAKQQKKSKKKDKKKAKTEKKIAKQEAKLRKKGVFLEDVTEVEEVEVGTSQEFKGETWVRKSTEEIPYLEKRIDRLAERKESSSLHDMFQEKYGEVLIEPETFIEYELSEAEKRRLERLRAMDEETRVPVEVQAITPEEEAASEEEEVKETKAASSAEKPWYHPGQLMLYNRYGKGQHIIKKILFLVISIVGWVIIFIPRIIIFIIMFIVNKIRGRKTKKTKKAKKAKDKKEVASEA
jgi:hypothetical protein